jgi:hypothetical protein
MTSCFQRYQTFVLSQRLPIPSGLESFLSAAQHVGRRDWQKVPRGESLQTTPKLCCEVYTSSSYFRGPLLRKKLSASGLYTPIRQFLLYDCDEVLDTSRMQEPGKILRKWASLVLKKVEDEFKAKKLFVVGAGAIGCGSQELVVCNGSCRQEGLRCSNRHGYH